MTHTLATICGAVSFITWRTHQSCTRTRRGMGACLSPVLDVVGRNVSMESVTGASGKGRAVLSLGNVGLALGHWREHFKIRGRTDNQRRGLCGYLGCTHSDCYTQMLGHWQSVHLLFECPFRCHEERKGSSWEKS